VLIQSTSRGATSGVRGQYGMSPTSAVQGSSVPFAGSAAVAAGARSARLAALTAQPQHVVARKADDRVPARGRPL
jgi:hypothetical protein